MLVYKKRNTFLQNLHPLTGVLLVLVYMFNILFINNPVYIVIIIVSVFLLSIIDGCYKDLLLYIKLMIPIIFFIVILNPFLNHNGNTLIFGTKSLPIIGSIRITVESLAYGFFMALRMIGVTVVLGFGNLIVHPDRALNFFSKYMGKSALLMSMTFRLFPSILISYNNIIQIEKMRGNDVFHKKLIKRLKNQSNIVNILFLSCLEDAVDMAESMYSRGYGVGRRSQYFYEKLSKYDKIYMLIYIIIFVLLSVLQIKGYNRFDFFPNLDNPFLNLSGYSLLMIILFYMLAFIDWRWKAWK